MDDFRALVAESRAHGLEPEFVCFNGDLVEDAACVVLHAAAQDHHFMRGQMQRETLAQYFLVVQKVVVADPREHAGGGASRHRRDRE